MNVVIVISMIIILKIICNIYKITSNKNYTRLRFELNHLSTSTARNAVSYNAFQCRILHLSYYIKRLQHDTYRTVSLQ